MFADFWLVVRWWGVLFLVGAVAFSLTKRLFVGWFDEGYFFSKAVGMAVVTWIVYAMGTVRILPFSTVSILVALGVVFVFGLVGNRGNRADKGNKRNRVFMIFAEELSFLVALLFWSWVKSHEPSIRGLEKFMDFGFMKSILNTQYFPASDMWYAGGSINYYYFGHIVTAVLTKLSGIDLAYTFNLMLATIFALTLTMSFSIGVQLLTMGHIGRIGKIGQIGGGLLTAFLVTLAGNLQTLYAFTKGYVGDNVQPFWKLLWPIGEYLQKVPDGMKAYWYANATRFIPYTIHEFPGYSFIVSDVHGHVLSLPFVLLTIAMLIGAAHASRFTLIFYGFLMGVLLMTNVLDGPIYLGLLVITLGVSNWKTMAEKLGLVVIAAGITALPFLTHFKSFVSGIAVNCPPAFLANTKIGPLIFEGTEKCQHSPIWMMLILWGFFLYCGFWLVVRLTTAEKMLRIFFFFSIALIIFPEFFYFKDIYPMHFRSNTMFKLGYQAFILFSLVSGYSIVRILFGGSLRIKKLLFAVFLLPQLFLVSIYPVFAVRSYFGELKKYEGLDGLGWIRREYPSDFAAINWLNSQPTHGILVEADGDSYTDYARFSTFTGHPTIVGWAVHEWLWRGSYDVVAPRREEVRQIYEETDVEQTKSLLNTYRVRYVVVGALERTKFKNLQEWKLAVLGARVFQSGETIIYGIDR
jgi:uncharacterized membrane protein